MWPESLNIEVSRETREKLEIYHALLLKWQRAINLVSPNTVSDAWIRHFADSAQLKPHVSRIVSHNVSRESSMDKTVFADLGCGGGFPGLVLAMMCPDLEIHLVESDERKCQFLRTVSRETNVDVIVHNSRIESCMDDIAPDIVSARALASLDVLLRYIEPWFVKNPDLHCLFMKGVKADEEAEAARGSYDFNLEKHPSVTDSGAALLALHNIVKKD